MSFEKVYPKVSYMNYIGIVIDPFLGPCFCFCLLAFAYAHAMGPALLGWTDRGPRRDPSMGVGKCK